MRTNYVASDGLGPGRIQLLCTCLHVFLHYLTPVLIIFLLNLEDIAKTLKLSCCTSAVGSLNLDHFDFTLKFEENDFFFKIWQVSSQLNLGEVPH